MLMKHPRRILAVLLVSALMLTAGAGCSKKPNSDTAVAPYDKTGSVSRLASGIAAENERLRLEWNSEETCILLTDKTTGKVWSTTPLETLSDSWEGTVPPLVQSPLTVEYINEETLQTTTVNGATGAVKNGRVSAEKLSDGVRITYYFDSEEIVVPVEYRLRADSLRISMDPTQVEEHANKVLRVSLTPFLCSIENNKPDSYLFVPSGSGALIYPHVKEGISRTFSGEIYGTDPSRKQNQEFSNVEPVRLPVFGVKDADNTLLGIVEEGAECVSIEAQAGNARYGFSSVYASAYLHGYEQNTIALSAAWAMQEAMLYSEARTEGEIAVGLYPLSGEQGGYNGMAARYRTYLQEKEDLPSESSDSMFYLQLLGGANTRNFFLGIPYNDLLPTTTVKQAKEILEGVVSSTGQKPVVNLVGFGTSGLDTGKIGGGFSLNSKIGSADELADLTQYAKQNDVPLYMDFDLIQFSKSSSGFSSLFDTAKTPTLRTAKQYYISPSLRDVDESMPAYSLLARAKLKEAGNALIENTQKLQLSGVGLSSLGSIAYSDFSSSDYAVKSNMAADVQAVLTAVKDSGKRVAVSAANAYAAVQADHIFNTPIRTAMYDTLDVQVPFYQMVFKGSVSLGATSVNIARDSREAVLRSLESGIGFGFTLSYQYDVKLLDTIHAAYFGGTYADNEATIRDLADEFGAYYRAIDGQKIKSHTVFANDVRKTVFENGVTVYVNYSDQEQTAENITVPAFGYRLSGVTT